MAAPLGAIAVQVAKVIGVDLINEPSKIGKTAIIIGSIVSMLMLLVIVPVTLIISFPLVFFQSNDAELSQKQLEIINTYKEAPIKLDEEYREWVDNESIKYDWCDSIRVDYSLDVRWQDLMAIDTVNQKQNFDKVKLEDCLKMGRKFIVKRSYTETYQEKVKYTYVDEDGNRYTEYVYETRTRAVIKVSTKAFDEVLKGIGFSQQEIEMANNIRNNLLTTSDVVGDGNLEQYPEGSANLPYFSQHDARWGNKPYGSDPIRIAGCGPTSLAMVVSGLTGKTIYPDEMANWSVANGHRAEGAGSYWSLMTAGGRHFGLKVQTASRTNPNVITKALSEGKPVIVSMGRGHFTSTGHFIVLRGITEDGKILVHDSNSWENSQQEWDIRTIMNESSTNGGVNGSPFFIFSK